MTTPTTYPDITLRDYVRVLFRQKLVIIVTVLAVCTALFIGLKFQTPVYEAQVKMLISAAKQVESPFYRDIQGFRNTEPSRTQSEIVKSNPVIEKAVWALRLHEQPLDYELLFASPLKRPLIERGSRKLEEMLNQMPPLQAQTYRFRRAVEQLRQNVTVEPMRDTDLFIIHVRDFHPVMATVLANTVSRAYVIFDLEQQLSEIQQKYGDKHQAVRQLRDNIDHMNATLGGRILADIDAMGPASVKIVEQAGVPLQPIGRSRKLIFLMGTFASLFIGVILAFLFDYLDQTVKTPQDAKRFLQLEHLGSIPQKHWWNRAIVNPAHARRRYGQAYTRLADQLYLLIKEKGLKSMLVTATMRSEGATTALLNLGRSLTQGGGHKVLVIDANLRDSSIHKRMRVQRSPGLAEVLEGAADLSQAVRLTDGGLVVMPSGITAKNPMVLLDSPKMRELMQQLTQAYDFVLIDGANLKDFKDSAVLSTHVDGIALVVREGLVRRQVIRMALGNLEQTQQKLLGIVLNRRTYVIPKLIYDWV